MGPLTSSDSTPQPGPPELSVVILCYRAGERARRVVTTIASALREGGIANHQLVLVGNYLDENLDPTPAVVRDLAAHDPRIVCSTLPKRGMMGWDMRSGFALATGSHLAVIDGDGQNPATDVVRGYRELERGGFALVKAVRVRRADGPLRRFISLVFNVLFHLLFPGLNARDINAKPKVMTRAAYEQLELTADDWFIDAEIMIAARRLGLRMGEIETVFFELLGRRSFINFRTMVEFLRNLVRYRLRESRLRRRV
jgi:glycosyltransferase involved in cell wall biosynthesis